MTGSSPEMAEDDDLMNSFKNYRRETTRLIGLVRRDGPGSGRPRMARRRVWNGPAPSIPLPVIPVHGRLAASSQMLRVVPGSPRRSHSSAASTARSASGSSLTLFPSIQRDRPRATESGSPSGHCVPGRPREAGGVLIIDRFTPKTWHVGMVHLLTAGTLDLASSPARWIPDGPGEPIHSPNAFSHRLEGSRGPLQGRHR